MNNEDLTWMEYLFEVGIEAKALGYNINQVSMFQGDIRDYWLEGKSVEQCVEDIF